MGLLWTSALRNKFLSSRISLIFLLLTTSIGVFAQTTGIIEGKVTDLKGAPVAEARVTITDKATDRAIGRRTSSAGAYSSGDLAPAEYIVKVEAKGFKTAAATITVQPHATATADFKLELPTVAVSVDQPGVERVISAAQLHTTPVNGLVSFEPAQWLAGIQLEDATTFDPTRAGLSSLSLEGQSARAPRFELDHLDMSHELTGGPTQNIPLGAIEEFSIQQSVADLSRPLSSAGSVNVVTKSGTNNLHGEGFYNFRDQAADASLPGASHTYFQRNQFGGNVGGAIVPDKFFFFADAQRNKQDFADPVLPQGPFTNLAQTFSSPFRETHFAGRADWQINENSRAFYRIAYDQNRDTFSPLAMSFQPFATDDHSQSHAVGLDFARGDYVHTVRFGYTRFHSKINDAVTGSSIFDPLPGIELGIGADPFCLTPGVDKFCSGPNYLSPQTTYQTDTEIKYDGSKSSGAHNFRFGAAYNRIQVAVLASYLGSAPSVGASVTDCARYSFCVSGDPTTYPVVNAILGNGLGAFSNKSAFGLNNGALPTDNRLTGYLGDIWKLKSNLTVRYGVSYVRDGARIDSDLPSIASLNQFGPGLGNRVRQPNSNFAPQLGVAWDPGKSAKTVFRGAIGLFYDNSAWQNALFDRAGRLSQGGLHAFQPVCVGGVTPSGGITFPDGSVVTPSFCGQQVGAVASQIAMLQQQYQAATTSAGSLNPVYAGNILADGINATGTRLFYPNYITPRSVQMNLGMEHEIREGVVFSIDYLRNVGTHILQSLDTNHVGASRYLDTNAALAAISATNNAFGCGTGTAFVNIDCAIANGAKLTDFAGNGLDSADTFCFGLPCGLVGTRAAAFPGANSSLGTNQMLFPMGRSVYNGVQLGLRAESHNPFRGVRYMNWQFSYSLSKYVSTARDNEFGSFATDYDNPLAFIGPGTLDRRHQVLIGSVMDVPKNFRVSFIGHFYSPLPLTLTLPPAGAGSIFVSDFTGDGNDGSLISSGGIGDVLPGTNLGAFGRRTKPAGLSAVIDSYNTSFAGHATPAGQALLNAGLLDASELQQLGAVMPFLASPPANQPGLKWLKTFDLSLSWGHKFGEHLELRPGVSLYNVFNFANFNGPNNPLSGVLDATSGSVNGTVGRQPNSNRIGLGSGVFGLGAPRMAEFTIKLTF